jgi:hypothetical protein
MTLINCKYSYELTVLILTVIGLILKLGMARTSQNLVQTDSNVTKPHKMKPLC